MKKVILPLGLILGIVLIFFWKVILLGRAAFPGDLLVGAYYPWLDHKWGYVVGVPIKNPLISDVFSQFFIWKSLIVSSLRHGVLPLWNPYSYSGYPLLATWHSGVLNPLNSLLFIGNNVTGWNIFVISAVIGSAVWMYFLLRSMSIPRMASIIGCLTYSFSGFFMVWLEFSIVTQAIMWLPLLLLLVLRFWQSNKFKYLVFLAIVYFCVISVGHFQMWAYTSLVLIAFITYLQIKSLGTRNFRRVLLLGGSLFLGLLLAAIQLLPAWGLFHLSIRNSENYIQEYNYGLLPVQNLITAWAPDFFGNPTTGNNWGFFNYLETQFYTGVVGVVAFIFCIFNRDKFKNFHFFILLSCISLIMAFDNPISRLIYVLHVPGLSTSSAGRILVLYTLGIAVITARFVDIAKTSSLRKLLKPIVVSLIIVGCLSLIMQVFHQFFVIHNFDAALDLWINHTLTGVRNSILPLILIACLGLLFALRKTALFRWAILLLVVADLFHFGWKFTPFVKPQLVFPREEVITWLMNQPGIFRIDREKSEFLPPNTWAYYNLSAPSGYDPIAFADYVKAYTRIINYSYGSVGRYSELEQYDAPALGLFNVKYLLALKRRPDNSIGGSLLNPKINLNDWKKVFESPSTAVLENKYWQSRARLTRSGTADIASYTPNEVIINYSTPTANKLILADTWYPGWVAKVNGNKVPVEKAEPIFRQVDVPSGDGQAVFSYEPNSFKLGLAVTVTAWGFLLLCLLKTGKSV